MNLRTLGCLKEAGPVGLTALTASSAEKKIAGERTAARMIKAMFPAAKSYS